jgi:hypothetical protein
VRDRCAWCDKLSGLPVHRPPTFPHTSPRPRRIPRHRKGESELLARLADFSEKFRLASTDVTPIDRILANRLGASLMPSCQLSRPRSMAMYMRPESCKMSVLVLWVMTASVVMNRSDATSRSSARASPSGPGRFGASRKRRHLTSREGSKADPRGFPKGKVPFGAGRVGRAWRGERWPTSGDGVCVAFVHGAREA